ncbi:MAG: hypothetical protein V4531_08190 [Actinomycetota bacterium]
MVVLATTQDIDAKKLRRALDVETRARSLAVPDVFEVPATWGARYAKLATKVPARTDYRTVELARGLMQTFIDPVLRGEASGLIWSPESLAWG